MKSITGCLAQMADDPLHGDSFHLADPQSGKAVKDFGNLYSRTHSVSLYFVFRKLLQIQSRKHHQSFSLV